MFFFLNSGKLVTNLKKIRTKYAKSWFALDFLASFPQDLISFAAGPGENQVNRNLLVVEKSAMSKSLALPI